jgi:hypothetical protein
MFSPVLQFLADELTAYLAVKFTTNAPDAVIANVALTAEAEAPAVVKDKVVVTLVNLEEDRSSTSPFNYRKTATRTNYQFPPLLLNVYFLVAANLTDYPSALKALGHVVTYFQHNKRFTPATHPRLDSAVLEVSVELYTMNFEQVNHLWSTLGGKYLPSALFKLRQLSFDEEAVIGEASPIEEVLIVPVSMTSNSSLVES